MKRKMVKVLTLLISLTMLLVLTACAGETTAEPEAPAPEAEQEEVQEEAQEEQGEQGEAEGDLPRVGLLVAHQADTWAVESFTYVAENAPNYGFEVVLFASSDYDTGQEARHLDTMMAMDLDLLLYWSVHEAGSASLIENFMEQQPDVPVMAVAVLVEADGLVGFVGWDQPMTGTMAGNAAADYIEENNLEPVNVVLLYMQDTNVIARREAFKEALIDRGIDHTILFEQNFEGHREVAVNVMENIIQADPDFDIVWTAFDAGALGARSALVAADHHARIFSSGGYEQEVFDLFVANDPWYVAGTALAPADYGPFICEAAARFLAGEEVGHINAPIALFHRGNFREILLFDE